MLSKILNYILFVGLMLFGVMYGVYLINENNYVKEDDVIVELLPLPCMKQKVVNLNTIKLAYVTDKLDGINSYTRYTDVENNYSVYDKNNTYVITIKNIKKMIGVCYDNNRYSEDDKRR